MIENQVADFLDQQGVKYIAIAYSPNCTRDEIEHGEQMALVKDLIEAVLIRVDGTLAMCAVPGAAKLDLEKTREALGTNNVEFIGKGGVPACIPACDEGTLPPFGNLFGMDVYLARGIENQYEVTFFAGSSHLRIRMRYSDYERLVCSTRRPTTLPTSTRYRVEVAAVTPMSKRDALFARDQCCLGVSLQNVNFSAPRLAAIVDWVSRHFRKCTVLIGDSIHRITIQLTKGIDESQAHSKALLLGRAFLDRDHSIFEARRAECEFQFLHCSEVQTWHEYPLHYQRLSTLYREDESFAASVMGFAKAFAQKRAIAQDQEMDRCVSLSCQYLLEEMAVFACLVGRGLPLIVYPGSIKSLVEITEGRHPGVPDELKRMVTTQVA